MTLAVLLACSGGGSARGDRPAFGWIDRSCLATAAEGVGPDTWIRVIPLDSDVLADTRVAGEALAPEACAPGLAGRMGTTDGQEVRFYRLERTPLEESGMAFAVLDPPEDFRLEAGKRAADLDGNGRPDSFTTCSTSEGIRFEIWRGEPRSGTPLWSGYYYLGYDLEPTCPELEEAAAENPDG